VAAGLLVRDGHEVIGLSMQLYDHSVRSESAQQQGEIRFGSCCTLSDLYDARRVAHTLGITHYIVNFERRFEEHVVSNFVSEYASGRTPIPCVHCNGDLKFASLVDRADGFGAQAVATGHYARVEFNEETRRYRLLRGLDRQKDQSYFLFTLTQAQLARARFPIGALDKAAVREEARRLGLGVADKPDSQEICFVAAGEHADFVATRASIGGGEIRDRGGRVLGRHGGIQHFTIGQRKGLGLAAGIPLYVVEIDAASAVVTVGPREALDRVALTVSRANWISGEPPTSAMRAEVRIRYRHREAAATIHPIGGNTAHIVFDTPQAAIAPGQAAVFFDGDVVLGGGWID
ncbi:MAG TPA: tRNA 2-thiouridine(34) synthase MnmA, partial [Vicinamibacterales bacterium]